MRDRDGDLLLFESWGDEAEAGILLTRQFSFDNHLGEPVDTAAFALQLRFPAIGFERIPDINAHGGPGATAPRDRPSVGELAAELEATEAFDAFLHAESVQFRRHDFTRSGRG